MNPTHFRILVVEDDVTLAFALKLNLEYEGYNVITAHSKPDGDDAFEHFVPHLVILDLILPGGDGIELLRSWRRTNTDTRIVILSGRSAEADRVAGLRLGADDYVTKPFSVMELLARISVQLSRSRSDTTTAASTLAVGSATISILSRTVRNGNATTRLRPKEFDLLMALVDAGGAVVSRDDLLRRVWGHVPSIDTRTLDYHIAALRRKLETDPHNPTVLLTIPKIGYRLDLTNHALAGM
jgi:two-component system alkaline phosphatase synthesis response regulator PhoP